MKSVTTRRFRILQGLGLMAVAAAMSSCTTMKKHSYSINYDPPATRPSNPSAVKVKISTGAQRVYVMEGSKVLLATPCSVGTAHAPTPAGNHTITEKTFKRRSHSYGDYPMPNWMSFAGSAYGMHWGFVKPYPCTHGCVRLPKMAAAKIFDMVRIGTPVNVSQSQPEDATVGKGLPVLDDGPLPNPPDSYMNSDKVFEDAKYKGKMYVN